MASNNTGMVKLIKIINNLQDVCGEVNQDFLHKLPQIAVVGSQSTGKSSVLENIVGKDFLPRGTGIVTRRPLKLQLENRSGDEYGEFGHLKGKKFYDFDEIRKEIVRDTIKVAGSNNELSDTPISLSIHSPNVPTLTLIDLPGLIKISIGKQDFNIEDRIRDMIMDFIKEDTCLILAVTPANTDLANSDALKLARQVDVKGERTIGVITKCDLMDKGTDCRDILDNKVIPLRLGYVGVVNRSQLDIEGRKKIEDALKAESDFFKGHSKYKSIANRLGTTHLQSVLSRLLGEHIRKHLPNLFDKLQEQAASLKEEIKQTTELFPADNGTRIKIMGMIINQVNNDFDIEVGDLGAVQSGIVQPTLGTEINQVFFERFPKDLSKTLSDESELRKRIELAISGARGIRGNFNTPQVAFESVARQEIALYEKPICECVDSVVDLLKRIVRRCIEPIDNYPKIREELEDRIISFIYSKAPEQKRNVLELLKMEKAYQNTNHEDFNPDSINFERQGILKIKQLNDDKQDGAYWFILTSKVLSSYYNQNEFIVPMDGFKMIDNTNGEKTIHLVKPDDLKFKVLKFACNDDEDFNAWKESFKRVLSKQLKTDVNDFHNKIKKYLAIVEKTLRDMIPKAIKLYIIDQLKEYIRDEMPPALYDSSQVNLAEIFETEPGQEEELAWKKTMLDSYRNASQKIRSILNETV